MDERRESQDEVVVTVALNQQQEVGLQRLREEGSFGDSDPEILRNVFRDFLRQMRF
jgi:hypothetical protein